MNNPLILNRNDIIKIIDHTVSNLTDIDLVLLVNTYSKTWIRYIPDINMFVWTGGNRPSYCTSVVESDLKEKMGIDNQ